MTWTWVNRAAWGAAPAKSKTMFPAPPIGAVVHYVGSASPMNIGSFAQACAALRAIQQDAFRKGYADIEYSLAVWDQFVFELRGLTVQSGANGDQTQNRKRWSVVFLTGVGEPLTSTTINAFREFRAAKLPGDLVEHKTVAPLGTSCPGTAIESQWNLLAEPSNEGIIPMTPEEHQLLKDLHAQMSADKGKIDTAIQTTLRCTEAVLSAVGAVDAGGQPINIGAIADAVATEMAERLQG